MDELLEASIEPSPSARFRELLSASAYEGFESALQRGSQLLRGRTMWHINTTLEGGGVAEMLGAMLPYVRGAGMECRWVVVSGEDDFLAVTKRIHNRLHGFEGDGGDLGDPEAKLYAETLAANAAMLLPQVEAGDVVFVHDPQTAGLIPALKDSGAIVIWHCHIGTEKPNDLVRTAWTFLMDCVSPADRYIFSRRDYLWDGLDAKRHQVIQPSIDAFTPKNSHLDRAAVEAILVAAGVVDGSGEGAPTFVRHDGEPGVVAHRVTGVDGDRPVPADASIVLQASRWDRLKDPVGVMELFAEHVAPAGPESHLAPQSHLVLMGPSVDGVADDPEGSEVLAECRDFRASLEADLRDRVHLMCPPTEDDDEADVIVNAMQRRADVVVQKSLAEGFGLVVAEAMWKERPVVASRVGGIQDQIEHGRSGVLIDDPTDGAGFGRAVTELLTNRRRAHVIGEGARERVLAHFLTPRQLGETIDLVGDVLSQRG
jgi:trehalose synthase